LTGGVTLAAGSNITLTPVGNTITIASSGGGGTGSGTTGATGATGPQGIQGTTGNTGTIPTNYVISFNGLTGAVTGVTVGGTNVFTALNSFNAGISAAGGATFATDISVNGIRVGKGAGNRPDNVALGSNTLTLNTTGDYNLAFGSGALASNLTGTDNVGLGYGALTLNTSSNNLGIGSSSLAANSTGTDNVGVGTISLGNNSTGSRNVAIGRSSLSLNGSDNVGIGAYSLSNILTAVARNYNTAIGSDAGRYRTGGSNLQGATGGIYIGYGAKASANAQTNEIVIGTLAEALGSNTAVIGATTQTAATIYGVLSLPGGLSAAGATFSAPVNLTNTLLINSSQGSNNQVLTSTGSGITWATPSGGGSSVTSFNGLTGAVTGVSRVNGLSGGITFAAGTGITFSTSGNIITVASAPNSTTQTLNFSESINGIDVVFYGAGLDLSTSLQYIENYPTIVARIRCSSGTKSCVLDNIQSFYDSTNGWSARIVVKPPFVDTISFVDITAETIIDESLDRVYLDLTSSGGSTITDRWNTFVSTNIYHRDATYVTKTVTGQSWVAADSYIECKVLGITSADHTPEDAILEGVKFEINNIVAGTGFDIMGYASEGTYGKYTIKCLGQ